MAMACISTGAGRGNRIVGNLIRDNDSLSMNSAIRVDDDQHEVDIIGNVIHRSLGEGIMVKGRSLVSDNLIIDLRDKHSSGYRTDYLRGALLANNGWSRGTQFRRNTVISTVANQRIGSFGKKNEMLLRIIMDNNHYYCLTNPTWADEHLQRARAVGREQASITKPLIFAGSDGQSINHHVAREVLSRNAVDLTYSALRWMTDVHNTPITVDLQRHCWPEVQIKQHDSGINSNK